jgi:hypothetical protein
MFKDFNVNLLMNDSYDCICTSSKRLRQFVDPDTIDDNDSRGHIRTIDTRIFLSSWT